MLSCAAQPRSASLEVLSFIVFLSLLNIIRRTGRHEGTSLRGRRSYASVVTNLRAPRRALVVVCHCRIIHNTSPNDFGESKDVLTTAASGRGGDSLMTLTLVSGLAIGTGRQSTLSLPLRRGVRNVLSAISAPMAFSDARLERRLFPLVCGGSPRRPRSLSIFFQAC